MNRHLKLITALLLAIFCFSIFTLTALAADLDGDGYDDETGEYIGVVTSPIVEDPTVAPDPVVTDSPYEEPTYEPAPVETDPVVEIPETDPYYNQGDIYDNNDDYNDSQNSNLYSDDDELYIPVETTPKTDLYESDREIDDSELSNSDWADIKANLSNASGSDSGTDDFDFIQKNDSTSDNGGWMLIAGVVCLLLSVAGIIYVIASSVSNRKKTKGAYSSKQPAYAGSAHYRSANDYNDGYKKSSKEDKKKLDRSRRYDTAEVKLPKSGTRYKNGGKRYK